MNCACEYEPLVGRVVSFCGAHNEALRRSIDIHLQYLQEHHPSLINPGPPIRIHQTATSIHIEWDKSMVEVKR